MTPLHFPALYQDRHAFVLGLGDSGLAMAAWAARLGARVTVWDSREQPPQLAALRERLPDAAFVHGEFTPELLATIDHSWVLLKSPGLSPLDARLKPLLARAEEIGLRMRGELELFAQALAELKTLYRYEPGVLAITGTNGKTTTTSMTALLVERAGRRVAMAGNIGPTLLGTLSDALDKEPMPQPKAEEGAEASDVVAAEPVDAAAAPETSVDADAVVDVAIEAVIPSDAAQAPDALAADASTDASARVELPAEIAEPAEATDATGIPHAEVLLESVDADAADAVPAAGTVDAAAVDETPAIEAAPVDERNALETVAELLDEQPLPIKPPPPKPAEFEVLPQVWVLELSSFQLDGVQGFEPSAGAVLNITQDHLDWHGDMPAYARAKGRIFGEHGVLVINRDDPEVEALVPAPIIVKQGRGRPAKVVERDTVRFGLDAPQRPGDFGLLVENGMAWLVRAREQEEELKGLKRRKDDEDELIIQRLMPADALRVRGRHNAANALAALALATAIGCPLAPMLHGLREYRGEPHRVEFVTAIKGVDFYDDSKGTNVGATVAAVMGLGADRAPAKLVMILGGDGKGQDFSPLATPIALHARAVALIGRDGPQIEAALRDSGVLMHRHDSLEAATHWALAQAHAGDSVLLSPACASLDMFRNYAHRAEVFIATVRELAEDEGFIG
ncbi:UDP-N-acetylmuramoyl-L-alanine--D-glutamate ligase [Roseateles chitosanitabidus]|uniref:UDP-N-acetylmuramoyl-L-alanine--D-glutamate ligase n=1 Tax=Roseateles chitosanitabidus TaxID=65048 RepID=UPI0008320392|nr:UDP-N-acetylmuramoyl-L-alanine--D-glutamate ligase [Roseateles chitosanitabidus]